MPARIEPLRVCGDVSDSAADILVLRSLIDHHDLSLQIPRDGRDSNGVFRIAAVGTMRSEVGSFEV